MSKNKVIQNLILLVVTVIATILTIEILLRVCMPLQARRTRYLKVRDIFQYDRRNILYDEELGYLARPNLKTQFDNEEFRTFVSTNSAGFRDDEASLKSPDIIVLGDSLAFGWGSNDNETCEKELEKLTGLKVLNMSLPGYGTFQEYLLLRRWSATHDLSGKTVIFVMYPNDVIDNLAAGHKVHPSIELEAGETVNFKPGREGLENLTGMYERDSYRRPIYKLSYIAYLYKGFSKNRKNRIKEKKGASVGRAAAGQAPAADDHRFEKFASVIDKIMILAKEKNFKVLFIWVPSVKSFEDNSATFGEDGEDRVYREVKRVISASSAPFIEAKGALSRDDYYIYDGHLKPRGNYKLGKLVADHLQR